MFGVLDLIPGWLLIAPVLAFLVFIHELGHFLAAKKFGIAVLEFGMGFPPRLWSFQRGETTYSVNLIPIGGFVRMLGEEDASHPRSFASQAVWKRVIVLCAGSFMNFATPLIIFTIVLMIPSYGEPGPLIVTSIMPGSPADQAGVRPGDRIIAVNGHAVEYPGQLASLIRANLGKSADITIINGSNPSASDAGRVRTVTLVPRADPPPLTVVDFVSDPTTEIALRDARRYDSRLDVGDSIGQGATGIAVNSMLLATTVRRPHPLGALAEGTKQMAFVMSATTTGIKHLIVGGPDPGFAGPIGIAQITGEAADLGAPTFLRLVAVISISLGIMNILPIPALDGGRLMFAVIEWARGGKKISPRLENLIHLIGFAGLMGLIASVSLLDILRILSGESIIP